MAEQVGQSKNQIQRFIRLTELIPELLDMLDERKIALNPAYRSGSLRWNVESGMWGIYRVLSRGIRYHCETACRSVKQWWEKKWYDK